MPECQTEKGLPQKFVFPTANSLVWEPFRRVKYISPVLAKTELRVPNVLVREKSNVFSRVFRIH